MRQNIFIVFILAFFLNLRLNAQTTELVYSLSKASNTIHIASVATDASDNIFICGSYNGSNVNFNPLVVGSDSLRTSASAGASIDGFIAKYNSSGQLLKVISFGNTSNDAGTKVYVDPISGSVYLLATIVNTVKFDNTGDSFGLNAGSGAMALVKYDNNLVLKIKRGLKTTAGATGDQINDIKVFGTDVYITGLLANGPTNFNPGGTAINRTPIGLTDIFVAKYDASLICQFAYNFGGTNADAGNGIDLDASGNIYLTGIFRGQNIDMSPLDGNNATNLLSEAGGASTGDVFVAKYASDMSHQWSFKIGAALADQGNAILVNKTNSTVYVGGFVKDDALLVYFDPASTTTSTFAGVGQNDMFVASYTSAGAYNWHFATGSTSDDNVSSMAFDASGNIVLSGFANGNVNFGNSKTITGLGGKDAYFAVLSGTTGTATAAYNVGGASDEVANGLAVSSAGKILLTGDLSGSGDYDPSTATKTITLTGVQDGFISRYVLCTPPSISAQPGNDTKCEGQGTSFSVTASGGTLSYQWKKGGIAISGATNSTYSIGTLAVGDAGNYTVDVTNSCQTLPSSAAVLTVNAKPTITSATTGTICSGVAQNYSIATSIPSNISWTRAAVTSITPTTGSGTTNTITETLVNGSTSPVNVVYVMTPTSTTGSCVGAAVNYTVTVNPKPAITSAASGSICSGVAQSYSITSNVASSYSWSRVAVAGITNAAVTGQTANPITEALNNNSVSPVVAQYVITPTSTTGSCTGAAFNYDVTVNPPVTPAVSITVPSSTICAGASVTFTATPANGGTTPTYQWKKGGANISGATNSTYTTTTAANADSYTVTMTSNAACASPVTATSNAIVITVNPTNPVSVSIAASSSTTICAGASLTFTATPVNGGTTPTYIWSKNATTIPTATNATYTTTTAANGDSYTVAVTSNASCPTGNPATSNAIVVTVNPTVIPAVSITASPSNTICTGGSVTFTASPTNGGTPTYVWNKNGTPISGATNATYATSAATNGDSYTVTMTSNAACASPLTATSSAIVMTVTSTVVPSVTVAVSPSSTICPNASVTFTATPGNGGTTPTYQWKKGGINISGETNATYTTTTAGNGDSYTVTMTSSSACASPATATSSPIVMTVNATVTPAVSIAASPSGAICAGTSVTFTATPTNGGTTPTYQWKKGGVAISGETNATYTTTTAANGDSYTVTMTSNAACVSPASATSTAIVMTVNAAVIPSVSTVVSPAGAICAGTSVTFTATPTNGGAAPTYQWKKGGVNISGETNATYTTAAAANGDSYTVTITSNATCASPTTATSTAIVMTVTSTVTPSVSISVTPSNTICVNSSITFTATPTSGGTTPTYQWKKGGINISGATNSTYTTTTAANGDSYTVTMTSNAGCASPATATSNAIVMTVNPALTPSVSASANNSTICTGTSITFTASPTNGGAAPTYKWKLGSSYITGATNATYVTTTAADNDSYSVEMVSNAACASTTPVVSNSVVITITASPTPAVAITAAPGNSICTGTSTTFTAAVSNGGTPTYKWKKGTSYISGATNDTYTSTSIANGDVYSVEIVSSLSCVTTPNATSNSITMTVNTPVTPSVSITSTGSTICSGASVLFTATPVNGGTPTYKWKLGSSYITGATNATYTTTSAANGDSYSVEMTSTAVCATPATVTSTAIVMTVNSNLSASVSITANNTSVCAGTNIIFTATPTNGGTTPTYKWKLGSAYITSATNATFSTTSAANNDSYSVEMTSNAVCATPATSTSNPIVVTVNTGGIPTITVTASNTTICDGTSITFTSTQTGGGTPSYKWKLGTSYITGETNSTYTTTTANDGDVYSVEMASTATCASPGTVTSTGITINVNPTVVPSVSITASNTTICVGSSVTFTATPVNGGTPTYKWKLGSSYITGATNATYVTTTAADGDAYSVEMVSNAACVSPASVASNAIAMDVNPILTPSVSISANNSSTCAGSTIIFTAIPTNGGTAPGYKWKLGSAYIAGATNSTYTNTTAVNGDSYSVEMISNATCATTAVKTSNSVVITITTSPSASVTISASPGTTICAGTLVTFTATPGNGGTAPTYQWNLNGSPVTGETNASYTSNAFADGDKVSVNIVSNSSCVSNPNASSAETTIVVNPVLATSVSIAASASTICEGASVTFTATPVNGGTPAYQWKSGSSNISGATGATYTSSSLVNGNTITVEMTSTAVCGTPAIATSNPVTMIVNPAVVPTVHVNSSTTAICAGGTVTLTASQTGGGTPAYKWKLNNNYISGATNSTYSTTTAVNNDSYTVEMTSSATCATPATLESDPIVVTINAPTVITQQPVDQSVCALGNAITFSVTATGANLTYQWKKGSTILSDNSTFSGTQTKILTISNVSASELASDYSVTATGSCGIAVSNNVVLSQSTTPISIVTQPTAQTVVTGGTISLSIAATGPSLTYQWKRNGTTISNDSRISGANTSNLIITNAQVSDNYNDYICVLSSPCATTVNSTAVQVTVSSVTSVSAGQAQGFNVYPNPNAGTFSLTNEYAPFEVEQIEIVSLEGLVVLTKSVSGRVELNEEILATELPSGMYLLIIKGQGHQALLKIAIDK